MHIVIFVDFHDSSNGGVQTSVRSQRKGLENLGHTVTIVSPLPLGKYVNRDPATICVPASSIVRPNGFPMVAPTKARQRYIEEQLKSRPPIDIIHVQSNIGVGVLGVRIAKKRSIPLVQTMHGRDDVFAETTYPVPAVSTFLLNWFHRRFIPHVVKVPRLNDSIAAHNAWEVMVNLAEDADQVVVPSRHFMNRFKEHGLSKPIEAISNGISDEVVARLPTVSYKATTAPLKVMWCGRLSHEKRPFESIEAVTRIPGAVLNLYGDGPLTHALQTHIDTHHLGNRVHLKGRVAQEKILTQMQHHDVLLHPSYGFESQGMVLLEAAAAGLPVVYCDPDLAESVPEGGGSLAKGTSVDILYAALLDLQAHPKKRMNMHKTMLAHRNKIVQSYQSKKMEALYRRLLKAKG